jgi:hypothetical protein
MVLLQTLLEITPQEPEYTTAGQLVTAMKYMKNISRMKSKCSNGRKGYKNTAGIICTKHKYYLLGSLRDEKDSSVCLRFFGNSSIIRLSSSLSSRKSYTESFVCLLESLALKTVC